MNEESGMMKNLLYSGEFIHYQFREFASEDKHGDTRAKQ